MQSIHSGLSIPSSTNRPSTDVYMMAMAMMASSRTTCSRRGVGCILSNTLNHIVATGYNGTPRGMGHCSPEMCPGCGAPSGTQLDGCMAIHAEQNALLQCPDTRDLFTCYSTTQPCLTCTKLLLNTSCQRVVYLYPYPHSMAELLWSMAGRELVQLGELQVKELKVLFQMMSERSGSALTMPSRG